MKTAEAVETVVSETSSGLLKEKQTTIAERMSVPLANSDESVGQAMPNGGIDETQVVVAGRKPKACTWKLEYLLEGGQVVFEHDGVTSGVYGLLKQIVAEYERERAEEKGKEPKPPKPPKETMEDARQRAVEQKDWNAKKGKKRWWLPECKECGAGYKKSCRHKRWHWVVIYKLCVTKEYENFWAEWSAKYPGQKKIEANVGGLKFIFAPDGVYIGFTTRPWIRPFEHGWKPTEGSAMVVRCKINAGTPGWKWVELKVFLVEETTADAMLLGFHETMKATLRDGVKIWNQRFSERQKAFKKVGKKVGVTFTDERQ